MAVTLLLIVVAGFSRGFSMRLHGALPELPIHLRIHGLVFGAWFLWLVLQTALVAADRSDTHRRTGVFGAGIAAAVVTAGGAAILGVVPRMIASGESIDDNVGLIAGVLWGNGSLLAAFAVFVTAAIVLRRNPAAHKRLMLLASISLMPPAIHRVGLLPALQVFGSPDINAMVFALAGLLILLLSLIIYDVISRRRLHRVTAWGVPAFAAVFLVCVLVIPVSGLGRATARWLVDLSAT